MELAAQLDDAGTRSADAVARLWRSGELSAKKDGIGVYKVPLCLAVSGQHGLANNALDEIVASVAAERRRTLAACKLKNLKSGDATPLKCDFHEILSYCAFHRIHPLHSIAHDNLLVGILVRMFCPIPTSSRAPRSAELRLSARPKQ